LDTDIFMGVTDKQEVVVWGNGRGVPFFGLKPQEMVDLELLTPRAGPEFDKAVKKMQKKKKERRRRMARTMTTTTNHHHHHHQMIKKLKI
jgi:hypothetical protein